MDETNSQYDKDSNINNNKLFLTDALKYQTSYVNSV